MVTGTLSGRDRARAEPRPRPTTERMFDRTRVRRALERCSSRSRACSRQQARPNKCSTERAARRTSVRGNACSIATPTTTRHPVENLSTTCGWTCGKLIHTLWKSYPQPVDNLWTTYPQPYPHPVNCYPQPVDILWITRTPRAIRKIFGRRTVRSILRERQKILSGRGL